jgi:tRNA (Thr-GGU) A37 N-methylase
MLLTVEPIGCIRKSANKTEIIIYSEFEDVVTNMVQKIGDSPEKGQKLLVVHKSKDGANQLKVTEATLIERKGNLLTVSKIDATDGPVVDISMQATI